MSPATMTYSGTLTVTSCWCGIRLAIPENLYRHLRDSSRNSCYCPLGHIFVFDSTLEDELEAERKRRAEAERRAKATRDLLAAEERSHAATKGHLTRTRRRVHRGICPHCKRHFSDLERHMSSKHRDAIRREDA